jgi:hypothetical protein
MQYMYTHHENDSSKAYTFKRVFFFNALMTLLSQIEHSSGEMRKELLMDLLDYINDVESADGLESILVTLVWDAQNANVDPTDDHDLLDYATEICTQYAANPTASGTGPFLFYNVVNKRLHFYEAAVARSMLKATTKQRNAKSLVGSIETHAFDALLDPFNTPYSELTWLSPIPEEWTSNQSSLSSEDHSNVRETAVLSSATAATAPGATVAAAEDAPDQTADSSDAPVDPIVVPGEPVIVTLLCLFEVDAAITEDSGDTLQWDDLRSRNAKASTPKPPDQPMPTDTVSVPDDLADTEPSVAGQGGTSLVFDGEKILLMHKPRMSEAGPGEPIGKG